MASLTLNDHPVTGGWVDLTVAIPAAANTDIMIKNLGTEVVQVVKGGDTVPVGKSGNVLGPREDTYCNAAHIWVRGGRGSVSIETL